MRFVDLIATIVWYWFGFAVGYMSNGSWKSGALGMAGICIGYFILAIIRRIEGNWR